jgi:lipopolysaccharide export system permease protein
MRTLHAYILREVFVTMVMTVLVFTSILLLGTVLKEVAFLLVSGTLTLTDVAKALALLIPYVWAYALPMGMLTATLLTFGRLSADQEITAARASGISLISLISPVLLLSVAMSVLSALCNLQISPACREAYKDLLHRIATDRPLSLLLEDRYVTIPREEGDVVVYVGKITGNNLRDVLLYQMGTNGVLETYLHAARGAVVLDATNKSLTLKLSEPVGGRVENGRLQPLLVTGEVSSPPISLSQQQRARSEPKPGNMTLFQLLEKLRQVKRAAIDPTPWLVELHYKLSFSFACISFTLVGIPLGIRAHRRETSAGMAMAMVLVLIFYGFFVVAQGLKTKPEWAPHLIVWMPSFLFQAVGAVLLRRANHGL